MIEFSNEIKVVIRDNPCSFDDDVYIMAKRPEGMQMFKVGDDGSLEEGVVIPPGGAKDVPPTMRLGKVVLQKLFTALQKSGMKPVEQSFVEGKLAATEEHLKDMRALVFEPKEIIGISEEPKL